MRRRGSKARSRGSRARRGWMYQWAMSANTARLSVNCRLNNMKGVITPAPLVSSPLVHPPPDDAAFGAAQGMEHDEGGRVDLAHDPFHASDLQARDDAVEDIAFGAAHAAVASVDRDAAAEVPGQPLADGGMCVRHDRDGGVLVDAIEHEVEGRRGGDISQDRVQRLLHAQNRHGHEEKADVEDENDVAHSK